MKFFSTFGLAFIGLALASAVSIGESPSAQASNYASMFEYFKALPTKYISNLPQYAPVLKSLSPKCFDFIRSLTQVQYANALKVCRDFVYLTPEGLQALKETPVSTFEKVAKFLPNVPRFATELRTLYRELSPEDIKVFFKAFPGFAAKIRSTLGSVEVLKTMSDAEIAEFVKKNFPEQGYLASYAVRAIRIIPKDVFSEFVEILPLKLKLMPELVTYFKYAPDEQIAKLAEVGKSNYKYNARAFSKMINIIDEDTLKTLVKYNPRITKYQNEIYKFVKTVPNSAFEFFVSAAPKISQLTPAKITELQDNPEAYNTFFQGA